MTVLFKNIKELIQVREAPPKYVSGADMSVLPTLKQAYLLVRNGKIAAYGEMAECPEMPNAEIINAEGRMLLPCWCDSHTHIVYAANRESEFVDRIKGLSYAEIAEKGGGILNSARKLQATSEDELYAQSSKRLEEVMHMGTGAVEIKSGYGLTMEAELKMLRVIQRLKADYPIPVKATFLAAHAIPLAYKHDKSAFLDIMLKETLAVVAQEGLADYIDVFCEEGYFDIEDTIRVMEAGATHGLLPKIHVNQFTAIGGVAAGVAHEALSVDHLEVMTEADLAALEGSRTMPVALPTCSFFLGIPYTPAREMMNRGLPLALATDYNPGSTPSGNMNFVLSTACIKMKMTPEEAINAATLNGAYAMGLSDEVGSITVGKRANLILTKPISSYGYLPYSFGQPQIEQVFVDGRLVGE